jgi:2-polyprenyl-3-methyl-5-hydroxy-6-metoxy-1,4-benzoquinol methylase
MDVKEASILCDKAISHWYYVAKGRALIDMLKSITVPEVLDVGAGSGVFAKILIEAGICQRAICVDIAYHEESVKYHLGRPIRFVRSNEHVTPSLVLIMDVLEHVEDDIGLLRQYSESMSAGGKVLITVPAFKFLWSGHDVFLQHLRRYTLPQIERRMQMAGLSILDSRYFFGMLLPLVALVRMNNRRRQASGSSKAASMLKKYPPKLNKLLTGIHDVERQFLFPFNRIAGLTIFCLAEKR